MPAAHDEPVDKEYNISCDEQGQCVDEHGASRIACGLDFTTKESRKREDHEEHGDDKDGE